MFKCFKWLKLTLIFFTALHFGFPDGAWSQTENKKTQKVYTVGVVPQFDVLHLNQIWQPIIKEIRQRTGIRLVLRGSSTIPAFEREFVLGKFDFAYMNPYHVLIANRDQGYIPLVRDHKSTLYGILVVKKDSPIESVKELTGKKVAFPAPNAMGASLMIRAALHDKFQIQIEPQYVQTHSSVYLNVALEEAVAGGGVQKTLNQQTPPIQESLRVLYRTVDVKSHPFVVHPRVDLEVREKVLNAFLEMGRTPEGKAKLSRIPIQEIGIASLKDYSPLRKMNLDRFYIHQ